MEFTMMFKYLRTPLGHYHNETIDTNETIVDMH